MDFLVDDYDNLSVLPIEVKSGKDYTVHSALNRFLNTPEYGIKQAVVLSNEREVKVMDGITYLPIYYVMFYTCTKTDSDIDAIIPDIMHPTSFQD